jgi:hypothetical protein
MDWVLQAFDPMQNDIEEESDVIEAPPATPVVEGQPPAATPPVQTQVAQQPVAAVPPVTTPPVVTPPAVPPVVAQPVAAQQAQTPVQTQQPPQTGAAEPEPTQVLHQLADAVVQQQGVFTDYLAQQQYGIPQQDLDALGLTPEQSAVLSKLQAKVHVNVVSSMTKMFAQQLPAMMHGLLNQRDSSRKAEDAYFERWPQLKSADKKVVFDVMKTYRQMNPQATRDQFIQMTGAMACAVLGLPIQVPSGTAPAPASPPAPLTPGPIVRQPNGLPAFVPAGTSTAPASSQPQPQLNEWDRLSRIMALDDQGAFDT